MIFTCIVPAFSLTDWMATRGLTGSLSKAVSDELLNTLGIGLFKKERSCDRAEAPYSTNKLTTEGWSSGKTCKIRLFVESTFQKEHFKFYYHNDDLCLLT